MISLVVVSHSRALALAARTLATQMSHGEDSPFVEVAAGLDGDTLGTDAAAVADALGRADEAAAGDGVLVLVDLGSAVLSAEMALELVGPEIASRVRVSSAPLVEGLVVAVVAAAGGRDLESCAREAETALGPKRELLAQDEGTGVPDGQPEPDGDAEPDGRRWEGTELSVVGEHGLHARPAARVVAKVAEFSDQTLLRLTNRTSGRGPVDGRSMTAVATLDAQRGHVLLAEATGPGAEQLLEALQELAADGFGDLHPAPDELVQVIELPVPPVVSPEPGVAGSGLEAAIGPAILGDAVPAVPDRPSGPPEEEQRVLDAAVGTALEKLADLAEHARRHLGEGEAEVFAAHAIMLQDPVLQGEVARRIRDGAAAGAAWSDAVEGVARRFGELPDEYQRVRAVDVRSLGDRVLRIMQGVEDPGVRGHGVLVVDELDPSLAISLDADAVLGVVTRSGGRLGHGVLIARSRGVPVLTDVGDAGDVAEGTVLAFDARTRWLQVDPSQEVRDAFEAMLQDRRALRETALADAHLPAATRDGTRVRVKANVSSVSVARLGAGLGAEGSGLVRTESVFSHWGQAPDVDEQVEAYRAIAAAYHPHPVTIRTWDVGGDKPLRFVRSEPEANPFLGLRGLRAFRADPSLLLDQLEAVCRVAQDHRVNVIFPMVTTSDDVDWARARLEEAADRAGMSGLPKGLGVGIMVEVPAVAVRLGELAQGLDLVSIGSNDLSQYALAAERGNPRVAAWSDPLDPAVLQLIRAVCEQAPTGAVVSHCGELAADPDVAALLVGLGVRELSSTASAVPMVKARLRMQSLVELEELAEAALAARDAAQVHALLEGGGVR